MQVQHNTLISSFFFFLNLFISLVTGNSCTRGIENANMVFIYYSSFSTGNKLLTISNSAKVRCPPMLKMQQDSNQLKSMFHRPNLRAMLIGLT